MTMYRVLNPFRWSSDGVTVHDASPGDIGEYRGVAEGQVSAGNLDPVDPSEGPVEPTPVITEEIDTGAEWTEERSKDAAPENKSRRGRKGA